MKIIILGSGNVGIELAKYLVNAGHAVTLVDNASEDLSQAGSRLDLRVVIGNPASPTVLRNAGAENTELLVAATPDDEINITACSVGAFLFRIPRKIARIRSIDYLREADGLFGSNAVPIDHVISPEHIITDDICDLIELPGTSAVGSCFNGRVLVAAAKVAIGGKLTGSSVEKFESFDGKATALAIYRQGKYVKDFKKDVFKPGDMLYFCCERERALSQLASIVPLKPALSNITIAGGTHIADALARALSERYRVKLIEEDVQRAKRSAADLYDTTVEVYHGNPIDIEFLHEEHIDKSDLFIAAAPADEKNIMASLILRRMHNIRTLAVIKNSGYYNLAQGKRSEIDTIISPKDATISALLSNIRQEGVENTTLFRQGDSEAIELALEGSKLGSHVIGRRLENLTFPTGVTLGLILRGRKLLMPTPDLVIEEGDHLLAYLADHRQMRSLVKMCRPHSFWVPKW
ncbi:MAG: Trk system potassium transporter TrkA [Succinatimonas sp.]|nr:Trk system potassium transporter TrkA [Succinatimonas sp.]